MSENRDLLCGGDSQSEIILPYLVSWHSRVQNKLKEMVAKNGSIFSQYLPGSYSYEHTESAHIFSPLLIGSNTFARYWIRLKYMPKMSPRKGYYHLQITSDCDASDEKEAFELLEKHKVAHNYIIRNIVDALKMYTNCQASFNEKVYSFILDFDHPDFYVHKRDDTNIWSL